MENVFVFIIQFDNAVERYSQPAMLFPYETMEVYTLYMINSHIIDSNNDDIADNVVDSLTPTVESFLYAIENRYVSELTSDDALLIYMFGHGTKDKRFQVLGVDNMLSASDLNTALDFLQHQTN